LITDAAGTLGGKLTKSLVRLGAIALAASSSDEIIRSILKTESAR
jgi:hypothetical protein